MNGFNRVVLAGNVTKDIELRFTPGGLAIAKFGLALNRKWKDNQTGEQKEEVTFVDVDSFGKQAETIGQYLKKGSPILMEGRLKMDEWEDKQTQQKRSRLGVVLESFTFLDNRAREGGQAPPPPRPQRQSPLPKPRTPAPGTAGSITPEEMDDIPY